MSAQSIARYPDHDDGYHSEQTCQLKIDLKRVEQPKSWPKKAYLLGLSTFFGTLVTLSWRFYQNVPMFLGFEYRLRHRFDDADEAMYECFFPYSLECVH